MYSSMERREISCAYAFSLYPDDDKFYSMTYFDKEDYDKHVRLVSTVPGEN